MYKLAENLYQGSAPVEPMEDIGAVFNLMLPSECAKRPKPENFNHEIYIS